MTNKLSSIKERILYLAENVEVSKQTFFKKINITYGNFTGENKRRPINSDTLTNILVNYPRTNPLWLLTGEGDMLISEGQELINEGDKNNNLGNNISGNRGNITISHNDFTSLIDIHKGHQNIEKELTHRLKESQEQITCILDILNKLIK